MTVGESLIKWLYGFDGFEKDDLIETDQLQGETGSYGLYKQPTTNELPFIDGSRQVAEYYYLLTRQSAKANDSRVNNLAWMESLEQWARSQNLKRALPALDGGRRCNSVGIGVSAYMSSTEVTGTAEYQVSITINYTEGKT